MDTAAGMENHNSDDNIRKIENEDEISEMKQEEATRAATATGVSMVQGNGSDESEDEKRKNMNEDESPDIKRRARHISGGVIWSPPMEVAESDSPQRPPPISILPPWSKYISMAVRRTPQPSPTMLLRRISYPPDVLSPTAEDSRSPSIHSPPIRSVEAVRGDGGDNFKSHEDIFTESIKSVKYEDVTRNRDLYISLLHNDWKEAENFIEKTPQALTTVISELSETFFHSIVTSNQDGAIQLLRKCLRKIQLESMESVLEEPNISGSTALFKAAIVGNIEAAKLLVETNRNLLRKWNKQQLHPLHYAGISGHKETVKYLLSETINLNEDLNLWGEESGFRLLVKILIEANLYDIASELLEAYPNLAREDLTWRGNILETLATKPIAFKSGSRLKYWQKFIYDCIPMQEEHNNDCAQRKQKSDLETPHQKSQNSSTKSSRFRFFGAWSQKWHILLWNIIMHLAPSIRGIHDKKLMHKHTVNIVRMMCVGVSWRFEQALKSLKKPILIAAKLGISEIVKEILKTHPDSLIFVDERGNNALMLAILHRQQEVFKFVSQFGVMKQLKGNNMRNKDGENILHLAAKSAPASEIPGAALQLQLQWFKAVENYVLPPLREERNRNGTPSELFIKEHKELIEKGEKWMKDNASSCTIVASLIITVMFTAGFTPPGGLDDKGIPNSLHELSFIIFVTSDILALCSSTASLLIFLGIVASSYSVEEFRVSLPRKLFIGLTTMFFSIACMMVAFGTTMYMAVSHSSKWVIVPIVLLSCIPVTLFAMLQFPVGSTIVNHIYTNHLSTTDQPLKKTQIYS